MRRLFLATGAAALLLVMVVASVAAAGPMGRGLGAGNGTTERAGGQSDVIADQLGLSHDAIEDLRHDGLSLAQIAEQQKVDAQKLVDALEAQWSERIEARVTAGALTPDEATALREQLETRAMDMVNRTALGGMQGAAVGAGPANASGNRGGAAADGEPGSGTGEGRGRGAGNGACDGSGPQGNGSQGNGS